MARTSSPPPSRRLQLAPLLRPAQWPLQTSLAAHAGLRGLGHLAVLASALVAWLWALAAWRAVWPLALAVAWSWHLVQVWRRWHRPAQALLLQWRASPAFGWHVPLWGDTPVTVRCVWDGQGVLLLRLSRPDAGGQAWAWTLDNGDREAHQLRTLLYLPAVEG